MVSLVPLVVIGLLVLGALPFWPWSKGWGWAPSGILMVGWVTLVAFQLSVVPD